MFNTLGNNIPTDWARRYLFDGSGNPTTGSNNATITNGLWVKSERMYQLQCLSWGVSTTCTYASVTYTNSYIWIYASGIWTFTKNSSKVTATALNGVNGERYAGLTFFNRTLTTEEEQILRLEGLRQLGPTATPKYPALLSGLVGYWDFRGTAHNLVDGVNAITNTATLTTDRFGNSNSAYSFDGSTKYIYNASSSVFDLTNYFISVDIYINSLPTTGNLQTIIYRQNTQSTGAGFELVLYNNGGTQQVFVSHATTFNPINYILPTGQWINLSVGYNGNVITFYLNGISIGTANQTIAPGTSDKQIAFGVNYSPSNNRFFNGNIGEIKVFNVNKSDNEVKSIYTLSSQDYIYPTPSYDLANLQDGLLIHLNGSNNGTTTLYDISGNGKNGTVSSTPTYKRQGKKKTVSLSSQSVSWTSTSFTMATCFEKVSGKWALQVNPAYITTTGITSGTREITDIRVYNRSLSATEQEQLKYAVIGNFIY